jgi:hypothetical protein
MKATQSNVARSAQDHSKAIESILYEMVILATALVLRDKRHFFEPYPRLQWGPPQIANDVVRLKTRLLLDFFLPVNPKPDDIILPDFVISPLRSLDANRVNELREFKRKVNKWTIHLSWRRATEDVYNKYDRQAMETHALDLLTLGSEFISECVKRGYQLTEWAEGYYENFNRLFEYLKANPRIEEGKGSRPTSRIRLESL